MAFDLSDVVNTTETRERLHRVSEENLQFRRAFETITAPEGTDNSWDLPNDDDVLGEPTEMSPGDDYTLDEEAYSTVTATRRKFGSAIKITEEAAQDNAFPLIARQMDKLGRKFQERLDSEAFSQLDGNLNSDSPTQSSNDSNLDYDDILAGKKELRTDGFNPDLAIIEEDGEEDLLSDADFTRSTDMGDDVVQEGTITRVSGMDVVVSNTGDLSTAHAFVVDTDWYGFEVQFPVGGDSVEMEEVEAPMEDSTYLKGRMYRDWVTMDAGAAIKVEG